MAMTLELTADQAEELGKALDSYLSDLRMEIAGTDSWDYRQSLKARKNTLSLVLRQVRPGVTRG